jgi:hypothetical protein
MLFPKNNYYLYFAVSVVIIFAYGRFRCLNIDKYTDPLENGIPNTSIDGWSFAHFSFYMLIGYKFPNTFVLTLILGILWELFETYIGIYKPKIFKNWGFCEGKVMLSDSNETKGIKKKWWYGKISDPIINIIGFIVGSLLHLVFS